MEPTTANHLISAAVLFVIVVGIGFMWGAAYQRDHQLSLLKERSMSGSPVDFNGFPSFRGPPRSYSPAWCWQLRDQWTDRVIFSGTLQRCRYVRRVFAQHCEMQEAECHVIVERVTERYVFGG